MTTKKQKNPKVSMLEDIRTISVFKLKESPENAQLYRERTSSDADFARLKESVGQKGVEQPILVSRDWYVISGHQRRKAAIETGRHDVPFIMLDIWRCEHNADEWLAVLREYNTGREKTFDELVREKLVDINPDDAEAEIISDQIKRTTVRVSTIDFGTEPMKRCKISQEKRGMADAVIGILEMLEDYLPISLRAIHYRMLNKLVWRNSATKLRYENNLASYKDLSDIVTRLRVDEEVSWDAIEDETRPVTEWACWKNAATFMAEKCEKFLKGYSRDLLQSQAMHFEVVAEKLTVKNFIEPIAGKYCMPVVIMRGNSGIDARHQISERFKASGKSKLFLHCMGDCDADGDSIVESTLRSMRYDFRLRNVDGTRVAITHPQADSLNLPKMLDAKKTSSNWAKFVAKHGREDCYEMEAVEPDVLQGWLDTSIRGVLDVEAFNHEVAEQTKEAVEIAARRKAVLDLMKR